MRKHIIVGTSGHIDHGKTSLIKHLTGIDADRWEAEKQRGITIDIGFAHINLPDNRTIGFVDVPGHEKFIKNMLAGATGMDLVLLIVSAEEGFMPQTMEHLLILSHLNIEKGIVVFTKTDLVDEDTLKLVHLEADDVLKNTFLENAPRIAYSVYDDLCKNNLIDLIAQTFDEMEDEIVYPASRMSIDRVFSLKGHGTVVTGTLSEGTMKVGENIYLYPQGKKVRIKSIQVYGHTVDIANKGQRVALNLATEKSDIHRGNVLSSYAMWEPTNIVDVAITVNKEPLKHWQRLRVYHGTQEILCRVALQNQDPVLPGERTLVQLRLEEPLYCKVNDPIVIRNFSPMVTIGGGKIINPVAIKHHWSGYDTKENENQEIEQTLLTLIENKWHLIVYEPALFEALPYGIAACENAWLHLIENQSLVKLSEVYYVSMKWWMAAENIVFEILMQFHQENPFKGGIDRETLRSKLNQRLYKGKREKLNTQEFQLVIDHLEGLQKVKIHGQLLKDPGFKVVYTKEAQSIKDTILSMVEEDGIKPVSIKELIYDKKLKKLNEEMLYHLINDEILVKINEEAVMHHLGYQRCREMLINYFNDNTDINVAEFRDLLNISRKASVEILEHFDRVKLTKRTENSRTLLKQ